MDDIIEFTIETGDGVVDCRLEPERSDAGLVYSATLLYPNVVNGFSRSEIYSHNMVRNERTGIFLFDDGEEVHPKIKKLEARLSEAIAKG